MSKKKNTALDETLTVRLNKKALDTFKTKAAKTTGKPYQLLTREIVEAFNSDRLRIIPTPDQTNTTGELYNVT